MVEPISPDDYHKWLTPGAALQAFAPLVPATAANYLQEAARSGLVRTAAQTISAQPKQGASYEIATYALMPAYYWNHTSSVSETLDFWKTGLLRLWFGVTAYFAKPTAILCFNVRFNPEDIEQHKPPLPQKPSVAPLAAPAEEAVARPEGGPVSAALLAKWATLYVETYSESEDTLEKVWASAKGMFQGKRVARDKAVDAVEKIRPRKPGKKAKSVD